MTRGNDFSIYWNDRMHESWYEFSTKKHGYDGEGNPPENVDHEDIVDEWICSIQEDLFADCIEQLGDLLGEYIKEPPGGSDIWNTICDKILYLRKEEGHGEDLINDVGILIDIFSGNDIDESPFVTDIGDTLKHLVVTFPDNISARQKELIAKV